MLVVAAPDGMLVGHIRESHASVNHSVFVATQITRKPLVLLERLSHAYDVEVAHNSATVCKKRTLDSVWHDMLICQKNRWSPAPP
jgi:hypothetical protein